LKKLLVDGDKSMFTKGTDAAVLLEWASDKPIRKDLMQQGTFQHVMLRVATVAANHIRNKFTETQNFLGAFSRG
jgi:hypothetical protein